MEPNNSFISPNNEHVEDKKVQQIVSIPAKTKKKSALEKAKERFFAEDISSIKDHILDDYIFPGIKDLLANSLTGFIDMWFYGSSRQNSSSKIPGTKVSYRSYYDDINQRNSGGYSQKKDLRKTYSYDEIILRSREEANDVLMEMENIIKHYGVARVADLYDLVGISSSFTDSNYGWTDIHMSEIIRQRDGSYLLHFPKPMPID